MNNPIIVTDRSLTYYDSKLKGYIGSLYGCDMTVEWEPMENGKNYFKLKIALKNKHGTELFSKIVDFPLEQTIVSGSYNNDTKSLILYFQDGTSTSIPIEDLIEGLASKLDLEKKADRSQKIHINGNGYALSIPEASASYAQISMLGGMTYKIDNTLYDTRVTKLRSIGVSSTQDLSIPEDVLRLDSYGCGINSTYYNCIDIESKKYIRKVRKRVFTGDENWEWGVSSADPTICAFWLSDFTDINREMGLTGLGICNRFDFNPESTDENGKFRFQGSINGNRCYFYLPATSVRSAAEAKALVKSWYSSGNPLTIIYVTYLTETVIDLPNTIGIEGGGTLTLENEYGYNVPYEIEYTLNLNEVISAKEFVGNLTGTSEIAKYYDDNGNPSTQTIGEALNKLLTAGNPIKITAEPIGQLSASQIITGISANIISNPPVAINDIIIDRYLDGDAAYLCFWLVTNISGGSTDSTMTLQGAGNIYVGGGSASVADRATSDGNGNNIVSTYETKAQVKAITDEIKSTASSAYERATLAINTAQDSINRVNRGVQSISADYTSGAGSIGTFNLRVNFVGGGSESYNITEAMRGLINDVLTYDR